MTSKHINYTIHGIVDLEANESRVEHFDMDQMRLEH